MAKLHKVAVYCALICVVMMAFVAGEEEPPATDDDATATTTEQQPVSEPPIKLVHVLNPGEREYLSPNLIGLQNIAMTFLPLSMSFINIIDAYREVVNGVRYEILLNAIDTKDNDKEIICELVILEKPWLRTEWGDKVRELRQTNCTGSDGDNPGANGDDRHARSKALNDKYQKNMLFDGGKRSELSADEMAKLEAQIMGGFSSSSAKVAFTKQNIDTTTTTTTTAEPPTSEPTAATEAATADPSTIDDSSLASTEPSTSTTKELSDDEKNWLDNIFSIGAFNFEQQQLQQKQQQRELLNEQALIERNEASNYVQPQSETQTTLELLMNANANDDDVQQRQQQEPETFDYQQQQPEEEVAQQQAAAAAINNLQLSQEPLQRSKRSFMTGGKKELNIDEAEQRLQASLDKLAAGDGPYYRIGKIHSATTQIVSGTLTEVDCDMINAKNEPERCLVKIWSQPWMPNGIEVTFKCADNDLVKARHSRSVEYEEKKTHKKQDHHLKLGKVEHYFNKFQLKYQRRYHSTMERQMRFRIFQQNLKLIEDLNRNEMGSAKYGITEFADMTSSEYKMRTGLWQREPGKPSAGRPADIPDIELPKEFDWREKGAVTAVKNQGNCGSCWAFSVTGNIEGINAVKTGQLHEFSEQELLDCDTIDSACGGGLPDNAYKAIQDIGGLEYEDEYPYTAHKDQCTFNKTMAHVKVTDFVDLPKNETAMAQWLIQNGPISIGINANAMQFYRGGVSHPWKMLCSKSNLDHGVLIVGYGISEYPNFKKNLPYWIIKNSWGPKWGEQGYYRVYRGENTCGVSEMASSAVLA